MKTPIPFLFLVSFLPLTCMGIESDSCSPFDPSVPSKQTLTSETESTNALDESIRAFLAKEGLLDVEGIHPFSSPKSKNPPSFFKNKTAEILFKEHEKRERIRQDMMSHRNDVKMVSRSHKLLNQKQYRLPSIVMSSE